MWRALYKKELLGLFNNYSAYFIIAVYLLLSIVSAFYLGLYFLIDNPSMRAFFAFQPQVLAIIIPAITMRSWADEQKSGTIELLFTYPLSSLQMITAKFFAAWSFSLILLIMTLPLAITTSLIIRLDWANIAVEYLGVALAQMLLVALGCLISSLNKTPIVAYLVSSLCSLAVVSFNLNQWVGYFNKYLPNASFSSSYSLDFSYHYNNFMDARLGLVGVLYFLSFAIVLLAINLVSIEQKRSR